MNGRNRALVFLAVLVLAPPPVRAWGDRTHQFLTRAAVKTLPPGAAEYYGAHVDWLVRRCLEPDTVMRAREGREEAVRHFIDLDAHMPAPFAGFPRTFDAAARRFGRRQVERNGVLPWVIFRFQRQLRDAIRDGDAQRVMREAGYLSHYVADAFQPLHLTTNYDGQKTGGQGLHKRYENDVVDAHIDRYGAAVLGGLPTAKALSNPRDLVFDQMFRTYAVVQVIVDADRSAARRERRGSSDYTALLDEQVAPATVRQLSDAASMIGSLWLAAWQEGRGGKRGTSSKD